MLTRHSAATARKLINRTGAASASGLKWPQKHQASHPCTLNGGSLRIIHCRYALLGRPAAALPGALRNGEKVALPPQHPQEQDAPNTPLPYRVSCTGAASRSTRRVRFPSLLPPTRLIPSPFLLPPTYTRFPTARCTHAAHATPPTPTLATPPALFSSPSPHAHTHHHSRSHLHPSGVNTTTHHPPPTGGAPCL